MTLSSDLTTAVDPVKRAFLACLANINAALAFLDSAESLRPRISPVIDWGSTDASLRQLLDRFLNQNSPDKLRPVNGVIVVGYAAFEEYFLSFCERCLVTIASHKRFSDLDLDMQIEHAYRTGRLLSQIKTNRHGLTIIPEELGQALSTCRAEADEYSLNTLAFCHDAGILTCENIEGLVARFQVRLDWDELGRNNDLKKFTGESKLRRSTKATKQRWDNLISARNTIAHSGGESLTLSIRELLEYVQLIELFATVVTQGILKSLAHKYG